MSREVLIQTYLIYIRANFRLFRRCSINWHPRLVPSMSYCTLSANALILAGSRLSVSAIFGPAIFSAPSNRP